jgi:putative membrane protein
MENYYFWFKVLHIFFVISWMCGILYLPRIYAYHTQVKHASEADLIFRTMERKLLRIIMNPSMAMSYLFGTINAHIYGFEALGVWFHIKLGVVLLISAFHGFLAKCRKDFECGRNKRSQTFYRAINEIPALLMFIAITMVVIKPFE